MTKRDSNFDSLKFISIYLVILGHIIELYIDKSLLLSSLYIFIYMFHMPLFSFISGYFTKNHDKQKLRKSFLKLLETFIVIQLVWEVIPHILNHTFELKYLYTPRWVLWYLLSLSFWKIFSFLTVPNCSKKYLIILSLIICYIVGFIPSIGFPLSLSRTFVFYPFFLIGCYTTKKRITLIRSKSKIISSLILASILILCIYFHSHSKLINNILWGSKAYSLIGNDIFGISLLRILSIFLAFIMIACVINLAPAVSVFSRYGKDTLVFYIYHGFIITIFYKITDRLHIYSIAYLFASSILITLFLAVFSRYKISHILLNPISYILHKINSYKHSN